MDIMIILIATTMEASVTGIVAIMIQDMDPVTGDEIKERGGTSNLLRHCPCSVNIPPPITPTYLFPRPPQVSALPSSRKTGFAQTGEIPCGGRIYAFPTVFTSFDPCGNK
jgi:hypothetical protein